MFIELYILFEITLIILFFVALIIEKRKFLTSILWVLAAVLSAMLAINSFGIEQTVYNFNASLAAYYPITNYHSYPWLMGINAIFFGLSLLFGFADIWSAAKDELPSSGTEPQLSTSIDKKTPDLKMTR